MDSSEEGEIKFKEAQNIKDIVFEYKPAKIIGQGTFGDVYLCEHNNSKLALKKMPVSGPNGVNITLIREISLLKTLNHPNIIKLLKTSIELASKGKITRKKDCVHLVFPFYEFNLLSLNRQKALKALDKISVSRQILRGLEYLHKNKILHRDLKSENILLNDRMEAVIADFGLARRIPNHGNLTTEVVTLWYRAPELLLGDKKYTEAIDMWSFGCILAEIYNHKPILQGESEIEQLNLIINLCGTINENTFPKLKSLKITESIQLPQGPCRVEYRCKDLYEPLLAILPKLLIIDPEKRLTASNALKNRFFR